MSQSLHHIPQPPPLAGRAAQKRLLNWVVALGNSYLEGTRSTGWPLFSLPSIRYGGTFPGGFLIPCPQGCGATGKTKGCYLELWEGEEGVGANGVGNESSPALMQSRKRQVVTTPGSKGLTKCAVFRLEEAGEAIYSRCSHNLPMIPELADTWPLILASDPKRKVPSIKKLLTSVPNLIPSS